MPRDFYEVLGVERDAGDAGIKQAFRGLARELHPDVNRHDPGAEEKFKEAAEAYEVLSDPERRGTYDAYGHEGLRSGGWAPRTEGFTSFEDVLSALFGSADAGFGDIFGGRSRGPAAGGDIGASVSVSLAEVLSGAKSEVSFDAIVSCERCRGNGAEPGTRIRSCETCGGSGQLRHLARTAFGQVMRTATCGACGGEGKLPETPCPECEGRGRTVKQRALEVDVPAGIESGQRIRIAGAGHAGEAGARPGSLYVEVGVEPDERFERHGEHLLSAHRISATRAMLGGPLTVPTLDGEREIEIPAGAQPGEQVVLAGEGLPRLRGSGRGDIYVVLDVVVPSDLSDDQRQLADRLEATLGEGQLVPPSERDAGRRWGRRRARR